MSEQWKAKNAARKADRVPAELRGTVRPAAAMSGPKVDRQALIEEAIALGIEKPHSTRTDELLEKVAEAKAAQAAA